MATELTWFGHGSWAIQTGDSNVLLDPYLDDNPAASCKAADLEADYILVSHGHFDHVADVAPIANRTGAMVVAMIEVAQWFADQHQVAHTTGINLGGTLALPFGKVKMTLAQHSSQMPDGSYGGQAAGFLLDLPEGKIYFACDTALFLDMQLIGAEGIDLAVLPIGDHFTMGPADSVKAVKLIEPRRVAPMHYNTWPPIEQDVVAWAAQVEAETSAEPVIVEPGGKIRL